MRYAYCALRSFPDYASLHPGYGRPSSALHARRNGRRDRGVPGEGGAQRGDAGERGAVLGKFVGVAHNVALTRLDGDGNDLVLEPAGRLGRFRLVLRAHRELILLLTGDLPLPGDVFGGVAHVVAVEGVPPAVLDHSIDHFEITHLHAATQMGAVRRHAHRFLAARHHDVGIPVEEGLVAEGDRAQARAAQLVDGPGRALDRDAGRDRCLPGRVLPLAGRQNLAHDHFGYPGRVDTRTFHGGLDSDLAEFMGRQ